jgi:HEAT repeat protein
MLWGDDPRTAAELFEAALQGDYEDEQAWTAVKVLRMRATPLVLELALQQCGSSDPKARARGLDVLGQLGSGKPDSERPYIGKCVSMAIAGLKDVDPEVAHSAAWALAHLRTDVGIAALIEIKQHNDPRVRHAVAFGLGGCDADEAHKTLIELMEDLDDEVRDWATFALGSLSEADSPEVREALRKRLDDPFDEARDEGIWGLTHRRDPAALAIVLARLESESWVQGDEDAASQALGLERGASVDELLQGLRRMLGR